MTIRPSPKFPIRYRPDARSTRAPVAQDSLAVAEPVVAGFRSHADPCPDPALIIASALRRAVKAIPLAP